MSQKKIILKITTAIILLLATATAALAQKHEVRAVWLTTIGGIDWPRSHNAAQQRQEMTTILDQLKRAGVNTVLIQTRIRASTIYPSAIEPFDMCLTGTHGRSPGYDPLAFIVDECHKRGMECHAWMVTIPVGKTNEARYKEFKRRNPKLARSIGQDGYMNPEDPATGDYIARICAEVTRNYDSDGVVEYADNLADELTDTMTVYALFANEDKKLVPGGTVSVSIASKLGVKRPAIPPTAVLQDTQGPYVWAVGADGRAERRTIARGDQSGDWLFVEKGLKVGERIVADGAHKVRRGDIVKAAQ